MVRYKKARGQIASEVTRKSYKSINKTDKSANETELYTGVRCESGWVGC